jgi:hypothetical protein
MVSNMIMVLRTIIKPKMGSNSTMTILKHLSNLLQPLKNGTIMTTSKGARNLRLKRKFLCNKMRDGRIKIMLTQGKKFKRNLKFFSSRMKGGLIKTM